MKKHLGIAMFALFLLSACAHQGPILLDIAYQPPEAKAAAAPKAVVGVSPFKDDRGKPSSVLGRRAIPDGMENDLVIQGTVSELVTARVKDALKARGFTVKDSSWDRTEGGIKADGADILLSGEIKAFGVDSVSKPFKTSIKAAVQMKIFAADTAEKKIIRTLDVNSNLERQDVLFSLPNVEDTLSEALSAAINQIFDDDVLKKKLQ